MPFTSMDLNKNKVLLGFSGGVDSTAAALFLKREGFEVVGLFFDVHKEKNPNAFLAETMAKELGIDFIYRNVHEKFSKEVIQYFCRAYEEGRTPNPCIICNPTVKFPILLEEANTLGAYHIATGHYAGIFQDPTTKLYYIRQAENIQKDQSYMLYRLGQDVLSRVLFPLNQIDDKEITRQLLREEGISNAERKDSQEICFIGEDEKYIDFIIEKGYTPVKGKFLDKDHQVLGTHQGIAHYTIGQRKGLGQTFGKPVYVTEVNHKNNTVTLGSDKDLFSRVVYSENHHFIFPKEEIMNGWMVEAKVRYTAKKSKAVIRVLEDGRLETHFEVDQRAVTPGQSIVFYKDNLVLGGGIIL